MRLPAVLIDLDSRPRLRCIGPVTYNESEEIQRNRLCITLILSTCLSIHPGYGQWHNHYGRPTPTIVVYFVNCNWFLNCITSVFRSFYRVANSLAAYFSPQNAPKRFGGRDLRSPRLSGWLEGWVSRKGKQGRVMKEGRKEGGGREDGHPQFLKRGCSPAQG